MRWTPKSGRMKKLIALASTLVLALLLLCVVAIPAYAAEASDGAAAASAAVADLRAGSDKDASKTIVSGLTSTDEIDECYQSLTDEERLYVSIGVEFTPEQGVKYSLVAFATPQWKSKEELAAEPAPMADATFEETLQNAWDQLQESIVVQSYGITWDNKIFTYTYYEAVSSAPEFFNVTHRYYLYYDDVTHVVTQVRPSYMTTDEAEYNEMRTSYEAAVAKAIDSIPCDATDLQKVYLLHNYVCNSTEYNDDAIEDGWDSEANPWPWLSYGALVTGSCVCQGYSLALSDLLNRVGIENSAIWSASINHVWNMVKIDGTWYHVDTTWDDTRGGGVFCFYSLKSDTAFKENGHWDSSKGGWTNGWTGDNETFSVNWKSYMVASDTQYDSVYNFSYLASSSTKKHSWNSGTVTLEPTCTIDGSKTYACTVCGAKKIEVVKAMRGEHSWGDWDVTYPADCSNNGTRVRYCSICGQEDTETLGQDPNNHNWVEDKDKTVEPTYSTAGERTYTCAGCGTTKTEVIPKLSFSDVSSSTDHEADINWLADKGVTTGWDNGNGTKRFQPYSEVARCDMAAFLYRLAGSPSYTPSASIKNYFSDVDESTPHYKEVLWLAEKGISKGWTEQNGSHTFRPYLNVARADMAAFLKRLSDYQGKSSGVSSADSGKVADLGDSHTDEILWLVGSGVSAGWDNGDGTCSFRPLTTVKRCDMAAFLHRIKVNNLV